MRPGCGCLFVVLVVLVVVVGGTWAVWQALERPDFPVSTATPEDGRRAQAKIYEVVKRSSGGGHARGDRPVPLVVLTEQELNAFVVHHLVEIDGLPVTDLSLRLPDRGVVTIVGRMPLGHLVTASGPDGARSYLPVTWAERPLWITLAGTLDVQRDDRGRRWMALDVERFAIGRQALPRFFARLILDPAAIRWLRWALPAGLEDVTIERGRVVIRLAA